MTDKPNATFMAFRESGKWYTTERGYASAALWNEAMSRTERRRRILNDNAGHFPGLSGPGKDFIQVVIADESVDYGWPLCLLPDNMSRNP